VSLPRGYNEAGAEWLEPWCDEHPDLDGQGCVACIGASHDAWMHRAKAAEREVARLRETLEAIRTFAKAPHNTYFAASCNACTIDACIGCLIEGTARSALEAGER
jgi:hypothetical protein